MLLTGCANSHDHTNPAPTISKVADRGNANSDDIMFTEMMVPHHEQAVTMATFALSNSQNSQVLALAKGILSAQRAEIKQMKTWLHSWGIPDAEHAMMMDGMLTDNEIAILQTARGADFDKLFLEGMIKHHEGAIAMADAVLANGKDAAVRALAQDIIRTQKAEITDMERFLKR